jgi:endonuclease YncB( thermonuclease family)
MRRYPNWESVPDSEFSMSKISRNSLGALVMAIMLPVVGLADPLTGTASVIDGDTLEVHGQRIRLHGVDAPESSQLCQSQGRAYRCGQQAANALSEFINRRPVRCDARDRDKYGRVVAVCHVGDTNLNAWLVSHGHAVAYRAYSTEYLTEEATARAAKTGIWAGTFEMPWEWRHHKSPRPTAPPLLQSGCLVKGNISRTGEHIYHVPGGRFYDRTSIDVSKGERMFCSEAEAQTAGWRKSLQ